MIYNMLVSSALDARLSNVNAAESARITTTNNLRITFPSPGYYYVIGYGGNRYDPHTSTIVGSSGVNIREMDITIGDIAYYRAVFVKTVGANESLTVTKTRSGSFTFYVLFESGASAPVFTTL